MKKSGAEKLKPHLYGPYKLIMRFGEVENTLDLLEDSMIHNTFRVSCLNKTLGKHVTTSANIPSLDEEG
jgi:hypothetical protein